MTSRYPEDTVQQSVSVYNLELIVRDFIIMYKFSHDNYFKIYLTYK